MTSLKEFFLPEGLKVDVTSPDGEQVHISKDDDQGIAHGIGPGLPIGAPPAEPLPPPMDMGGEPPLMDEPAGEEPALEPEVDGLGEMLGDQGSQSARSKIKKPAPPPPPEPSESLKRLGEMVGFRLAEGDDDIDLSDFASDEPKSGKSSSAEPKSSKKSFSKSGEIDPDTLASWRKEMSVRDQTRPKGHQGRWYGKTALPGWDDPEAGPVSKMPTGISGEWSWEDIQGERPEIAASFSETGLDPTQGDFLGDEGRTMWVPKDEEQNAWQWDEGEGWTEMTPEVWQDIADVRDQKAKERDELSSMPDVFGGGEEEPSDQELSDIEAGEEELPKAADGDEPELGDFVPGGVEKSSSGKPPEDPTSSRAPEPKKSASKGSGRAPEVGTPEWDDFLKSLE